MEARYQAITAGFSMEQQELERWVLECRKRHGKSKEELAWLRDKYKLEDGAWKTVLYSREEEYHQRSVLEERERKENPERFRNGIRRTECYCRCVSR